MISPHRALVLAMALLGLGEARRLDRSFGVGVPRADLNESVMNVGRVLDSVGTAAGMLGMVLLLALAAMHIRRASMPGPLVALIAVVAWSLSGRYSDSAFWLCLLALLYLAWWLLREVRTLSAVSLAGSVVGLIALESALRHWKSPWLSGWLFEACELDPLRAWLLWGALCGLTLLVGFFPRPRNVGFGLALGAVLLGTCLPPRIVFPQLSDAPGWIWYNGGPKYSPGLDMKFPIRWEGPATTLAEAQRRAILAGDEAAHRELWDAVLATDPLSLPCGPWELEREIERRESLGLETLALRRYLSRPLATWKRERVSGRLVDQGRPVAGETVRLVRAWESLESLDRVDRPEEFHRGMWSALDTSSRSLEPSSMSRVEVTDSQGRFEFPEAERGSFSLLLKTRDLEVSEDGWGHMKLLKVEKGGVSDIELFFPLTRVQDGPRNLELKEPLLPAWRIAPVRLADGTPSFSHDAEKGWLTLRCEPEGWTHFRQTLEAAPYRGKTMKLTLSLREIGPPLATSSRTPELTLELRAGGRSFGSAQTGASARTGELTVSEDFKDAAGEHHREESTVVRPPRVLSCRLIVPEQAVRLQMGLYFEGMTSVTIDSMTLEEVKP